MKAQRTTLTWRIVVGYSQTHKRKMHRMKSAESIIVVADSYCALFAKLVRYQPAASCGFKVTEMFFVYALYGLSAICALLYIYTRTKIPTSDDERFITFQRNYLTVYLLAVAGDWLQGPHVYALYESSGMSKHEIELLFVGGFASSLLFGTFIAALADKYGRKSNCFLYGILYAISCVTKHFVNFWIFMIGRLFGGIATSILYSAFESWLVYEHNKRGFDEQLLTTIFSHATLGNSVVAIISGVVAQYAADMFGFITPFQVSLAVLILMTIVLLFTWPENYGDQKSTLSRHFADAIHAMRNDGKMICLCFIQSLFEGAMYVFVLEWTPALTYASDTGTIPHGYIFASFMVAIMMGSSIFKVLSKYCRPESFMRIVLLISSICLAMPIIFADNEVIIFVAFIIFEVTVGIFWPAMGFMRGIYIPEQARSTIMNFCRIPLNAIVITILLQDLSMRHIFQFCVLFLVMATLTQQYLHRLLHHQWKGF
uniref:Molybdate-anion transporter n=1 Tax=Parascaris univalens TaxID=6257 RepID=A0A915BHX8_PARUN